MPKSDTSCALLITFLEWKHRNFRWPQSSYGQPFPCCYVASININRITIPMYQAFLSMECGSPCTVNLRYPTELQTLFLRVKGNLVSSVKGCDIYFSQIHWLSFSNRLVHCAESEGNTLVCKSPDFM